jgi:uncharacterized protein with HEPN domain
MSDSDDLLYLDHIAERIRRIESSAEHGREAFEDSHVLQDAIIRNFEVIGEAVKQLSPDLENRTFKSSIRMSPGAASQDSGTF